MNSRMHLGGRIRNPSGTFRRGEWKQFERLASPGSRKFALSSC